MLNQKRYNTKNTNEKAQMSLYSNTTTQVRAKIILGMPSKNCQFHGICKIEPDGFFDYRQSVSTSYVKAIFVLNESKKLEIHFEKKELLPKVEQEHFSNKYFQILEEVKTPDFINKTLKQDIKIKVGVYSIIENKTYYKVLFGEQ